MTHTIKAASVLAGILVVGVCAPARADTVEVKVPFPFVLNGQTLPAGQYQLKDDGGVMFLRGEHGNHAGVFFETGPAGGSDPKGNTPVLSFTKVANQYRLSDIWESHADGREVEAHR